MLRALPLQMWSSNAVALVARRKQSLEMGTDGPRVTAQQLRMLAALPEMWSPVPAPVFSYCQQPVTPASGIQVQGLLIFSSPCTHVHNPTHPQTYPRNF